MDKLLKDMKEFVAARGAERMPDNNYEKLGTQTTEIYQRLGAITRGNQEAEELISILEALEGSTQAMLGDYRYKQGFRDCIKLLVLAFMH
jgi:hypothetical protein